MNKKIALLISTLMLVASYSLFANNGDIKRQAQIKTPRQYKNYRFSALYYNSNNVYNHLSAVLSHSSDKILQIALNPSGATYAMLCGGKRQNNIFIGHFWNADKKLSKLKLNFNPQAMCYSDDARSLIISDDKGYVHAMRTTVGYYQYKKIEFTILPHKLAVSKNMTFVAGANRYKLQVYAFDTGKLRREISFGSTINSFRSISPGD